MLDGAMLVWFILTGLSILFLVVDLVTNTPVSWVQKLAWFLVVCYTGPVGLCAFLYACRRPFPGGHDAATKAWWKQGINSEVHCLAGDATGIIIAASIVPAFALGNGWDIAIEYTAGFVCGLFIFQALMMIRMFNGKYFTAVRKTFFAEAVSMNFVMVGMIPTMILLGAAWPDSMNPTAWDFWFRMSVASIVGGVLAFPVNAWLVARKLKHGCMTLPGADGAPTPQMGHAASDRSMQHQHAGHDMAGMAHAGHDMAGMKHGEHDMAKVEHAGHDMAGMKHGEHDMAKMERAGHDMAGMQHGEHDMAKMEHGGHDMAGMGHAGHAMGSISVFAQSVWVLLTLVLLVLATYVTHFFTPITF